VAKDAQINEGLPGRKIMWQNLNQVLTLCAVSLGIIILAPFSLAEEVNSSVVTVIHIDAMPQFTQAAAAILIGFRSDSLRDTGAKAFRVLQEVDHPNHFTLVEEWSTRNDYESHNIAVHTRHFRDQLQPMLGSPFDERIHTELILAP
jgi:quinol monooxygenase YgiN